MVLRPPIVAVMARSDSTANASQLLCISFHMARSAADTDVSPRRPVDVISGSRLAMFVSFIASAAGLRPMASAMAMISGFLLWSLPKGRRQ